MIYPTWLRNPILDEIDRKMGSILVRLNKLEAKMSVSLDAINASVSDLVAKVSAATTLDASVATLVQAQVAQLKTLSEQIAALQAGTVTQDQINAVAQSISAQATTLDHGTAALQAAIPANT